MGLGVRENQDKMRFETVWKLGKNESSKGLSLIQVPQVKQGLGQSQSRVHAMRLSSQAFSIESIGRAPVARAAGRVAAGDGGFRGNLWVKIPNVGLGDGCFGQEFQMGGSMKKRLPGIGIFRMPTKRALQEIDTVGQQSHVLRG